jgi:hypothetical protein
LLTGALAVKQGRDRPEPEDPLRDRRGLEVNVLGGGERHRCGCMHPEMVVLVHLGFGHEPVEKLVAGTASGPDVAVAGPRDRRIGAIGQQPGASRRTCVPESSNRLHEAISFESGGTGRPGAPDGRANRSARALIPRSCLRVITMSPVLATMA